MTEAALFYEAAISGPGDDFLDDIQHAIDSVRDRPALGTLIDYGFRRALIRRFPFSIVYAIERGKIVVVAVAHHRRSPDYWVERV